MRKLINVSWLIPLLLILTTSCETNNIIISSIPEREANEIVVFLASKGIPAQKIAMKAGGPGDTGGQLYSISVNGSQATEAMALLNQYGLPRKQGTNLLELFAKQGLMSSDKEETIRYRAGLAAQIANTIRKIDGVIDADVQISFPETEEVEPGAPSKQKITASVYVKHQGVMDDPNSHLVTKIKRLVAGSVNGLDVNDVTVVSDRAILSDITLNPQGVALNAPGDDYVNIWSITLSKESAGAFRLLFFSLLILVLILGAGLGWTVWKFYPILKNMSHWREFLSPVPFDQQRKESSQVEGEK